jgi:hypothetical protein
MFSALARASSARARQYSGLCNGIVGPFPSLAALSEALEAPLSPTARYRKVAPSSRIPRCRSQPAEMDATVSTLPSTLRRTDRLVTCRGLEPPSVFVPSSCLLGHYDCLSPGALAVGTGAFLIRRQLSLMARRFCVDGRRAGRRGRALWHLRCGPSWGPPNVHNQLLRPVHSDT